MQFFICDIKYHIWKVLLNLISYENGQNYVPKKSFQKFKPCSRFVINNQLGILLQ